MQAVRLYKYYVGESSSPREVNVMSSLHDLCISVDKPDN